MVDIRETRESLSSTADALDAERAADVPLLAEVRKTFSAIDTPAPILDLNYEQNMALAPFETYTRSGTLAYTDAIGAAQTAASMTPAFDHQALVGSLGWRIARGLKCDSTDGISAFNPTTVFPASNEYTIVVDMDRVNAYSGSGMALGIHGGSVANRIELGVSGSYQPYAVVQSGGSVKVNVNLGAVNGWYGGPRRLVLVIKSGAYVFAADGSHVSESALGGGAPSIASLTNFQVGGSTVAGTYFTGTVQRVQILPVALTKAQALTLSGKAAPVACWGDSLTAGTGASGVSGFYPEVLRLSRYPHSGVYNGGVGGETSTQIKTRMVADDIRKDWTAVIWAGRNNIAEQATILADVAAMVAHLGHKRFVILGVTNRSDGTEDSGSAAYNQIVAINGALAAAYPSNFIDIRSQIVAASGGTNDAPAPAWTSDGLHFNNTGYAYVAQQVGAFLRDRMWL